MGNEVEIAGKTIGEETKISLSVKTALWIIGGVITLFSTVFTYAYFDVKKDVSTYKIKLDESNAAFIKKVEESIDLKLDKQRDRDDKFIEDIAKIKGDIQLLLDRNQRVDGGQIIQGAPTIYNNTPTQVIPKKRH